MKLDPPPWLAKTMAPILVVLSALSPILELQKGLSSASAISLAVLLVVLSLGWALNVWYLREPAILYGAPRTWKYSKAVRYSSVGACLVAISLAFYIALPSVHAPKGNNSGTLPPLAIPFSIYSSTGGTPIWLKKEAEVEILRSVTPATDELIASARVRVSMPKTFTFNDHFQVDSGTTEYGQVSLPKNFDASSYIDRGLALRLSIHIGPSGQTVRAEHVFDEELTKEGIKFTWLL